MRYHVRFGIVLRQRVCVEMEGNPRNWGALGPRPLPRRLADLQKHAPPICYPAEYGRSRSNGTIVINRDVNKAGSFKAKAKSLEAKAKARSLKAKTKAKARDQG